MLNAHHLRFYCCLIMGCLLSEGLQAQFGGRSFRQSSRNDYATWTVPEWLKGDTFTFVRIQYTSGGYGRRGRSWSNDYPDADWNFAIRLHELTSMAVDPDGKVMTLTDPELLQYPFAFMSNVGNMTLSPSEVKALATYLLTGGFLMADDFWAPGGWENARQEMKRVFPDREPQELSDDHELFGFIYDLEGTPQVPSIFAWQRGEVFEYWHGDPQGDEGPHFWGYFDDKGRLMALFCHNNDIADGWEREGENSEYFRLYSERVSYPLGINIVMYALSH
tara:strand:+ start:265 stop:1095 length:831 start_codon:yes stop_codon:yes gene_type:complete